MSKDNGGPASDRELLEMAAKAAGIVGVWHDRGQCIHVTDCAGMSDIWWRPLTDDGDALRLAVNLGLCVQPVCSDDYDQAYAAAYLFDDCGREAISVREAYEVGAPPYEATRRAIVRAAAAIGSAM